jgi:DNA-binding MarR family transcriptional regulator
MTASPITDSVNRLIDEWQTQRPDLDFSAVGVISRLQRIYAVLAQELDASFAAGGFTGPVFSVLSVLRRHGQPFTLSQREIAQRLGLTAGTISIRTDQLVELGLVTRDVDPHDRRATRITLTEDGLTRVDAWLPVHLGNEERLLLALTDVERSALGELLRTLLVSFEHERERHDAAARLGMTLVPAHTAASLRRAVGLPPRAGLLVRSVDDDGPAAAGGVREGDLLVGINGQELRSILTLEAALPAKTKRLKFAAVRGTDERTVTVELPTFLDPPK